MNTRVCLVSPKPPILQRARRLKLDVVCVYTPEEFQKLSSDIVHNEICLVFQHHSAPQKLVEAVRALHDRKPFSAVVTVQEEGVITAALLNDALGLNGVSSETVALLTDKWRMRRHTAERGVSVVRAAVASSLEDIREFGAAQGYPLIAKPMGASSSIGIHKIDSAEAAKSAYASLSGLDLKHFLLEEYLEGPEISVDVLSFDGHHVPIAIADKITGTSFVEFGHVIPAQLDPSLEKEVCRTVSDFLNVVGLHSGLSHTELKLTSAGLRVIESHNRRGGDRINTMTQAVYGIDLEEAGLAWAVGLLQPFTERPVANCGAAIVFFEAEPGRLVAIEGADGVRTHAGVVEFHLNYEVGQLIPKVLWSLDRAGFVVVTADTAPAARDLAQALASQVRFVTKPDPAAEEGSAHSLLRYRNLVAKYNQVPPTGLPPVL